MEFKRYGSRLLILSTRQSNGDNYYGSWTIQNPQLNNLYGYKIALKNASFPNSVYPINSYNNKISFNDGGGLVTITLDQRNYNGSEMAVFLSAAMTAAGSTVHTVTYDSDFKKLVWAALAGTTTFSAVNNNAYEELGISTSFTYTTATYSTNPVNLGGTSYVDIVTDLANENYATGSTNDILCRVPMNASFGEYVSYEPSIEDIISPSGVSLGTIRFQLRDDKGNLFQLPDNAHMSLVFKLYFNN